MCITAEVPRKCLFTVTYTVYNQGKQGGCNYGNSCVTGWQTLIPQLKIKAQVRFRCSKKKKKKKQNACRVWVGPGYDSLELGQVQTARYVPDHTQSSILGQGTEKMKINIVYCNIVCPLPSTQPSHTWRIKSATSKCCLLISPQHSVQSHPWC